MVMQAHTYQIPPLPKAKEAETLAESLDEILVPYGYTREPGTVVFIDGLENDCVD